MGQWSAMPGNAPSDQATVKTMGGVGRIHVPYGIIRSLHDSYRPQAEPGAH